MLLLLVLSTAELCPGGMKCLSKNKNNPPTVHMCKTQISVHITFKHNSYRQLD